MERDGDVFNTKKTYTDDHNLHLERNIKGSSFELHSGLEQGDTLYSLISNERQWRLIKKVKTLVYSRWSIVFIYKLVKKNYTPYSNYPLKYSTQFCILGEERGKFHDIPFLIHRFLYCLDNGNKLSI